MEEKQMPVPHTVGRIPLKSTYNISWEWLPDYRLRYYIMI